MTKRAVVMVGVLLCSVSVSWAGITFSGQEMGASIPFGARAVGMGGAYTAVADDATAPFFNPAGLAGMRQLAISANLAARTENVDTGDIEEISDLVDNEIDTLPEYNELADILRHTRRPRVDVSLEGGLVIGGTGLSYAGFGGAQLRNIDVGPEEPPAVPSHIRADATAFAVRGPILSHGLSIEDGLDVGINLRLLKARGWTGTAEATHSAGVVTTTDQTTELKEEPGTGIDIGVLMRGEEGLRLGAMLENVNEPAFFGAGDRLTLKRTLNVGAAKQIGPFTAAADLRNLFGGGSTTLHAGVECRVTSLFALRAGLFDGKLTAGVGLNILGFRADLATGEDIKALASIGAGWAF